MQWSQAASSANQHAATKRKLLGKQMCVHMSVCDALTGVLFTSSLVFFVFFCKLSQGGVIVFLHKLLRFRLLLMPSLS
jgi:hypothetical protein